MTNKDTNKIAFEEAEREIQEERVNEVKKVMKIILQKTQNYKDQKAEAEEALRLLKLDLEDLKDGELEKIKKRHAESTRAREFSPIDIEKLYEKLTYDNRYKDKYRGGGTSGIGALALPNIGYYNGNDIGNMTTTGFMQVAGGEWDKAISGTYTVTCSNGVVKEFFL